MKILKDGFRADMERIKRELTTLQGVSIHVGILGDAGSDILMIAGVHEYGATISAKNVKHLAIPLNMEAKNAGSPRKFNDLRFIPISPGYGFLVRDRKHPQKAPGRKKQEKHDAKKHPSGGEEDPRPNEDYEWMYMLVDSVTIQERSFIRASFDTGKATLENICKEAVDGIILKKWTAQEAADYIGKWAVEMTHDYSYIYTAELPDSTSALIPSGAPLLGSFHIAEDAGVVNGCETGDGVVKFYSKEIPAADISTCIILFGKGGGGKSDLTVATREQLGHVKIGNGIEVTEDGTISANAKVSEDQIATSDDTSEMLKEIYGE